MMDIGRPRAHEQADIVALWQNVFKDSAEDVAFFLERCYDNALVLRVEDKPVSMVFLLPTTLVMPEGSYSVGYIYAGATHPAHRGKGYYRRLLEIAREEAMLCGMAALFLQPADDALFYTYRRLGFTVPLVADSRRTFLAKPEDTSVLSPDAYRAARSKRLREYRYAFVDWPTPMLEIACRYAVPLCFRDGTLMLVERGAVALAVEWFPPHGSDKDLCEIGLLQPLCHDVFDKGGSIYIGYGMD